LGMQPLRLPNRGAGIGHRTDYPNIRLALQNAPHPVARDWVRVGEQD
jgi:hypothetical protein